MTDVMVEAVTNGLLFGVAVAIWFAAGIPTLMKINPEIMLLTYPPDIRAKYGEKRLGRRPMEKVVVPIFYAGWLAILVLSVVQLNRANGTLTFSTVATGLFVTFFTANVFDLVILDWLWFINLTPKFAVLPGTEGLPGYKDYAFHFRGFLTGCVISVIVAMVGAGIVDLGQVIAARR